MPRYNFGIYHWRRRFRRLAAGLLACAVGLLLLGQNSRVRKGVAVLVLVAGLLRANAPLRQILDPPPWGLKREKYEQLARGLDLQRAENVLDVGSGTGRSLVGMAPFIPSGTHLLSLDVFDARVILGNTAGLTHRNATRAGLDVSLIRGDAEHLPVGSGTQDVVTMARILHDLPDEASADAALAEARRVLSSGGELGVLEVPITHEAPEPDALEYWYERVQCAEFSIEEAQWVNGYVLIHATPI